MADDAKKKDEKHEDAPPKKGLNKMIIIGGAVALLLVIGGGAFFFLNKKDKGAATEEDVVASEAEHGEKKEKKNGKKESSSHGEKKEGKEGAAKEDTMGFAALEPFIVNLMDNTGTRYLKVTIQLEMDKQVAVDEVKTRTPQIRDAVLVLLSSKTYADIGTVQGKYQLRDEVIARVNQILKDGKVKTAYFTEFVVQ